MSVTYKSMNYIASLNRLAWARKCINAAERYTCNLLVVIRAQLRSNCIAYMRVSTFWCIVLAKKGKKHLKRSSSTTLYGQRDKKLRRAAGNSSLIWSARIQLSFFFLVPYHRRLRCGTIWQGFFAVVIGFCSLNFPFHVDAFDVIYGFIKVFNFRCSV